MATENRTSAESRPKWNRRKFIVDKRFQYQYFRICFWTGMMVVAMAVLMYAALKLFFAVNVDLHPAIARVLIGIPIFIGIFTVVFGYITVRMTHKVAGPAFGLERSIHRLRKGELEDKVRVREGDYLKNLAAALDDLRGDLTWQRGQIESLQAALQKIRDESSSEGVQEVEKALERSRRLLGPRSSAERN